MAEYVAKTSTKKRVVDIIVLIILILVGLTMLLPFAFALSTSLKEKSQVFAVPIQWIPHPAQWGKYAEVFQKSNFVQGAFNTCIIEFFVLTVGTFTSSLAAFSFEKMHFRFKKTIFILLISTMMIPYPVVMIPQFVMFSTLHWVNTLLPLIVPGLFGNVAMIFFLRQNLTSIPDSLVEAAKIDGCGYFRIYWQIVLPLLKAPIVTQIVLWFMAIWNDYMAPLLYLSSPEVQTIQVVMANFNSEYAIQTDYALIMAAAVIALLPTLIIFFACQKYIIESITITGLKA